MFEDRIFECCHRTLSIFALLSGLMRGTLRFVFSICRHEKLLFLTAFVCSLGLLLPDFTILLVVQLSVCQNSTLLHRHPGGEAQGSVFAAGTPHAELLHFSMLDKVLWVKCFSLFISKHVAIPELFVCLVFTVQSF